VKKNQHFELRETYCVQGIDWLVHFHHLSLQIYNEKNSKDLLRLQEVDEGTVRGLKEL